jgi:hypothetical protein
MSLYIFPLSFRKDAIYGSGVTENDLKETIGYLETHGSPKISLESCAR